MQMRMLFHISLKEELGFSTHLLLFMRILAVACNYYSLDRKWPPRVNNFSWMLKDWFIITIKQ